MPIIVVGLSEYISYSCFYLVLCCSFHFDTLYFLSLYYVTVKHLGQHLMLFKGAIYINLTLTLTSIKQ